jgi:predicted porin
MKKSLLATTALAALGAVAVASPASAKFEVAVGGFMEQWFGYSDNSNTAVPQADVMEQHSDTEVHVFATQTLDNGLKFKATIEMEAEAGGGIDEQYLAVDGSFGRIIIGNEDQAARLMHYNAGSNGIGMEEGDGDAAWIAGASGTLSNTNTHVAVSSDDNNVTYFTPRINGFQVGVSYIPEQNDNDTRVVSGTTANRTNDPNRDNSYAVAVNYVNSFENLNVALSAGYTDGGVNVAGSEHAFTFGTRLGFGGFTLGFAYGEHDRDDGTAQNVNNFAVNLGYKAGPAGVSIGYTRGEDSPTDDKQDQIEIGGSYAVGPGITAKSSLYYVERVNNGGTVADGVAIAGGLVLSF